MPMNSSECLLRREAFDLLFPRLTGERCARGPMIAADHLAILLNQPLGEVCRSGQWLAEGLLKAQELYRSDFIIVFSDVAVEAEAIGVKLEYSPDRNPQTVQHLQPHQLKPIDIVSSGRVPDLFWAARICREKLGGDFPIFFSLKDPFSLAALTIGTEAFLEKLIMDRSLAADMIEVCCRTQLSLVEAIISEGFIPLVGAPIASGGLIGQTNFRRFAAPYQCRLFDRAEQLGSFRCLHICGEIGMLAGEMASLKLHLLSFEDWHASMWEKMPQTVPMGFVSTDLFVHGDKETVANSTAQCKKVLPEPFVLSSGCDLPARARPELVQTMMKS